MTAQIKLKDIYNKISCCLVRNIKAQHIILNKPIII